MGWWGWLLSTTMFVPASLWTRTHLIVKSDICACHFNRTCLSVKGVLFQFKGALQLVSLLHYCQSISRALKDFSCYHCCPHQNLLRWISQSFCPLVFLSSSCPFDTKRRHSWSPVQGRAVKVIQFMFIKYLLEVCLCELPQMSIYSFSLLWAVGAILSWQWFLQVIVRFREGLTKLDLFFNTIVFKINMYFHGVKSTAHPQILGHWATAPIAL